MENKFTINTELNPEGVVSGVEEIKKTLEQTGSTGQEAGRKLGQNMERGLNSALVNMQSVVDKAISGLKIKENIVDTKDMGYSKEGIQSLIADYRTLRAEMLELGAQRDAVMSKMASVENNNMDIENLRYYKELDNELEQLDFKYGKLGEKLETVNTVLRNAGVDTKKLAEEQDRTAQATDKATNNFNRLNNTAKRSTGIFDSLKNTISKVFRKLFLGTKNANNSFTSGLKTVLKYAFGISTLVVLTNKLRNAIKDGYAHLSKYSSEVRKELLTVTSALGQFKNQIGASFQPIIAYVAPILKNLINLLTQATVAITNFFATLTGQSYIYKAVDDVTELANGFGSATDKAKELKNATSGLDELNVINKNDSSSGGGGGSTGTFEKVPVEPSAFAQLLKDMINAGDWEGLGKTIAEKLADALKSIDWDEIRRKARETGENFSAFLKGLFDPDEELFREIGITIAEGINTAFEFLDGLFADEETWKNLGTSLADGLDGFLDSIDTELIGQTISDAILGAIELAKAFFEEGQANETFTKLGRKIGELIENINWTEILKGIGDVIVLAIQSAIDIWDGTFDGHPIAEKIAKIIAGAFFGAKIASMFADGFARLFRTKAVESAFANAGTNLGNVFALKFGLCVASAMAGLEFGKDIGEQIFPEDKELYENFGLSDIGGLIKDAIKDFTGLDKSFSQGASHMKDMADYTRQFYVTWDNFTGDDAVGYFARSLKGLSRGFETSGEVVDMLEQKMDKAKTHLKQITQADIDYYTTMYDLTEEDLEQLSGHFANLHEDEEKVYQVFKDGFGWNFYDDYTEIHLISGILRDLEKDNIAVGDSLDYAQNYMYKWYGAGTIFSKVSQETADNVSNFFEKLSNGNLKVDEGAGKLSTAIPYWRNFKEEVHELGDFSEVSSKKVELTIEPIEKVGNATKDTVNNFVRFKDANKLLRDGLDESIRKTEETNTAIEKMGEKSEELNTVWTDSFTSLSDGTLEIMNTFKTAMDEVLNGIITSVEVTCNSVINGINMMITALNSIQIDIPDMTDPLSGKVYAGQHINFAIPTLSNVAIPRLARGAVIPANREFMAVLGDQHNGTNVEAPLDTIKQALIEALDDSSFISYLASISDYTRVTSEKDMSVRIGDRDIARANIRGQRQMGRTLITSV